MIPAGQIKLRPVENASDEDFLLRVYSSSRAEEMMRVPWPEEQKQAFLKMQFTAQQNHYAAAYPQARHDIIYLHDEPVGRIYVERDAERVHILDITVLPEHRGQGVGTALLRRLMDEAGASRKPVTIYVEFFNPSLKLFERLGFQREKEQGFQFLMKWQAQP
jgi:ribosomal protein S18 acetylase RimI-like enzyme